MLPDYFKEGLVGCACAPPTQLLMHWYKSPLCLNSFNPSSDLREIIQGKTAFMRNVRIREEGDIGDAVAANEEIVFCQMFFHYLERGPAPVALRCQ